MSLIQADAAIAVADTLRQENEALRERLAQLTTATTRIAQQLDADDALRELVNAA